MSVEVFDYIAAIFGALLAIIKFIDKTKGNKRSLTNIKKRFEIYDKIIMNANNEVLSYTYLKDYLGCPISNDMVKYILKSTFFYDFVAVWKNIYTLVVFDPETKRIKYKNNQEPKTKRYAILYFIFLLPSLAFLYLFTKPIPCEYLITLFLIAVSSAIVAIFFFLFEYGDRVLAIKLMEKLEKQRS